ncbi:hypothetical protein SAMN05421862_10656 [Pseudomonas extremaustralis]|nr:hypothetical protein SAMN05421862_10656 [Pseudomonas extremaustralis]
MRFRVGFSGHPCAGCTNIYGVQSLGSLNDFKFHVLARFQRLVSVHFDR